MNYEPLFPAERAVLLALAAIVALAIAMSGCATAHAKTTQRDLALCVWEHVEDDFSVDLHPPTFLHPLDVAEDFQQPIDPVWSREQTVRETVLNAVADAAWVLDWDESQRLAYRAGDDVPRLVREASDACGVSQ
jgi:hypothetical protein